MINRSFLHNDAGDNRPLQSNENLYQHWYCNNLFKSIQGIKPAQGKMQNQETIL